MGILTGNIDSVATPILDSNYRWHGCDRGGINEAGIFSTCKIDGRFQAPTTTPVVDRNPTATRKADLEINSKIDK